MGNRFGNEPFGSDPLQNPAPGPFDDQAASVGGEGHDIWDFSGAQDNYSTLAEPGQVNPGLENYSDVVAQDGSSSSLRPLILILLLLLCVLGGFYAWDYYQTGENPFEGMGDSIDEVIANLFGVGGQTVAPPPRRVKKERQVVTKAAPAEPLNLDAIPPPPNPYWNLPNSVATVAKPQLRGWSPEEEEGFRLGLTSRYTYQRYKAVQDVRKARLRGSEAILWDAIQESKLWTRMWAAVGLAEFGIEISIDTVERALGSERSELVQGFFKRFIDSHNAGSLFVLRQALKLVDDRSRVIIHKALWRAGKKNPYRNLYLVAATYDPGPRVQRFVRRIMRRRPMSEREFIGHQRLVLGVDKPESFVLPDANSQPAKVQDGAIPVAATYETPAQQSDDPVPVDKAPQEPRPDPSNDEEYDLVEFYDMIAPESEDGSADLPRPAGLQDTFEVE